MSRKSLPDFNSYDHFYNSWCCFAEMKNTWIKVFAVELLTNNIKDLPANVGPGREDEEFNIFAFDGPIF